MVARYTRYVFSLAAIEFSFATLELEAAAQVAVDVGLDAAAILDSKGKPLALAGDLDANTARALIAFAAREAQEPKLRAQLNAGKLLTTLLEDREVNVGIVAGVVFVVLVFPRHRPQLSLTAVEDFMTRVGNIISEIKKPRTNDGAPPPSSPGGSSSGPAELPVVEIGVSVPRGRN